MDAGSSDPAPSVKPGDRRWREADDEHHQREEREGAAAPAERLVVRHDGRGRGPKTYSITSIIDVITTQLSGDTKQIPTQKPAVTSVISFDTSPNTACTRCPPSNCPNGSRFHA